MNRVIIHVFTYSSGEAVHGTASLSVDLFCLCLISRECLVLKVFKNKNILQAELLAEEDC
jgi:hypothetical protein